MPESVNFDRIAHRYDDTRGGEDRGRVVAAELGPRLPKGQLLEIGVGTGLIAAAFVDLGWQVVGVDLSKQMLAYAARRVPGRVARADASALPIADSSVDVCLAVHVLHLVGSIPAVAAEVARVLRPGGRFAVVRGAENADSSDITKIMNPMLGRLSAGRQRERDEQLRAAADLTAYGLRLVEESEIVHEVGPTTPAQTIEFVAARTSSRLWDLSDDVWASVVEPALAELRTLPDQDRPRPSVIRNPVQIFEAVPATPARLL